MYPPLAYISHSSNPVIPRQTSDVSAVAPTRLRAALGAAIAFAFLTLATREAAAFCRSTTCTCKLSDQVNGVANPCEKVCPTDADGCKTTGVPVSWSGRCIGFSLSLEGTSSLSADQWTTAITQAFETWGSADCGDGRTPSIDARRLIDVVCGTNEYTAGGPNANTIYFEDNGFDGRDPDHTIALTTTHFDHVTGEIQDADMALNSAIDRFSVSDDGQYVDGTKIQDLVSVVTHEVGHFFGLDHSKVPGSVMYFQAQPGLHRELSPDDIAGICAIYPPDREASCDPVPPGGIKSTCAKGRLGCAAAPDGASPPDPGSFVALGLGALGLVALRSLSGRKVR